MRRFVLVPVAAALIAACGTGGDLPQLPVNTNGAAGTQDNALAGGAMTPYRNVRYELAEGVSTKVDHATAYRFPTATVDDARRVAKAFRMSGEVHAEGTGWSIGPEGVPSDVASRVSMYVGRNDTFSVNGNGSVSSGSACAQVSGGDAAPQPCPTTSTTENPNLPTNDKARTIALAAMKAAGVDTDHATVKVERYEQVVTVLSQPTYGGGVPASMETYSVSIAAGDEIVGAYGVLGAAASVGSYELASLPRAVERLNEGFGGGGPRELMGAAQPVNEVPTIVKLTAVSVGLMSGGGGDQIWELPAYVFTTDANNGPVITLAAADTYFPTTTTSPSTSETKPSAVVT
jgi:hypothetical protein